MIDKDILKEILKNTVLSYKDAVSNVNINTLIHCVDDNTYAKCIKKISELEKKREAEAIEKFKGLMESQEILRIMFSGKKNDGTYYNTFNAVCQVFF
mgnify:CR=1 FL=1